MGTAMDTTSNTVAETADASRRSALEARLVALEETRRGLTRVVARAPWLLLSALGAIPAGVLWGAGVALAVLLTTVVVSGMAMYLAWSHEQEYAAQQDTVRQAIAEIGQPTARKGTPWRVQGKALQW